jgi:hypothetical protein
VELWKERERGDFLWLQLQQGSGLLSRPVPRDALYGSCSKKKLFSLSPNNSVIVTDVSGALGGDRRIEHVPGLS